MVTELVLRPLIHLFLHVIIPAIVAKYYYSKRWIWSWLVMLLTMVIDLDHLFVRPIYNPDRCSLFFHPMHSYFAIVSYVLIIVFPKMRLIGLGLLIHIVLDGIDCVWLWLN